MSDFVAITLYVVVTLEKTEIPPKHSSDYLGDETAMNSQCFTTVLQTQR